MFDSHAHVNIDLFNDDRDQVIARAKDAGLLGWIEVGTNLKDSKEALELANQHENVFATAGVHPSDIGKIQSSDWAEFKELFKEEKVKAVGEVGLDFYRGGTPQAQIPVLKEFIKLAKENDLPVVFHVRSGKDVDAHAELINLLRTYSSKDMPKGVIHTYSGSKDQADQYLDFGLYMSISGVVTFKNAGDMTVVAKEAPLERLLIETDCPFLAPEPYRGKRNEPAYVALVAQKIADLRQLDVSVIKETTTANTQIFFSI